MCADGIRLVTVWTTAPIDPQAYAAQPPSTEAFSTPSTAPITTTKGFK
jgi:hypothetical protein